MKLTSFSFAAVLAVSLAACGGGGGGSTGYAPVTAPPTAPAAPTGVLQTAVLNGGPAFITSAQLPAYTFSGDTTANQSTCTGGCLTVWPAVIAQSGTLPSPWGSFTRSDTGALQLTYNGKPLYTFASDSALSAHGDGVNGFQLARP